MFLMLGTVITILIYRLRVKDRLLKKESPEYKNEIRMLRITLVVFSISYLMRWIWDAQYLQELNWSSFEFYLGNLIVWLFVDFLPFICMFVLHFKNLQNSRIESTNLNFKEDENVDQ